jgi:hypothetical protein
VVAVEKDSAGGCKPVVEKKKVLKLYLSMDYDGMVLVLIRQEYWVVDDVVQLVSVHHLCLLE